MRLHDFLRLPFRLPQTSRSAYAGVIAGRYHVSSSHLYRRCIRSKIYNVISGYAVIAVTEDAHVKYGMTFLMSSGLYMSVPCILVWLSGNSAGHYKRATVAALQLAIA